MPNFDNKHPKINNLDFNPLNDLLKKSDLFEIYNMLNTSEISQNNLPKIDLINNNLLNTILLNDFSEIKLPSIFLNDYLLDSASQYINNDLFAQDTALKYLGNTIVSLKQKIAQVEQSEFLSEVLQQVGLVEFKQQNELKVFRLLEIISRYQSPFGDKLLNMLAVAMKSGLITTEKEIFNSLLEISSQILLDAFIRTNSPKSKEGIKADYKSFAIADNFHFPSDDSRTLEAFKDVISINRRGLLYRQAFSPLKFAAQRTYDGENSELIQFGEDCITAVSIINSSNAQEYPGKGFKLSGLKLESLFVKGEDPNDPYKAYKDAWDYLSSDLEPTAQTEYYFLRGCFIVSSPSDSSHNIKISANGNEAHYSLLIVNDHFTGKTPVHSGKESFYLVPTEIIQSIIREAEINIQDYIGFDVRKKDINDRDLNVPRIYEIAQRLNLPVLNLGTGSNFAGGLTNSWLPGKKWFFPHEMFLKSNPAVFSDAWGHTHKGDITGRYSAVMSKEAEEMLRPFQEASSQVSTVAHSLFNRLDILFIGHAAWTKGFNIGNQNTYDDNISSQGQEFEPELSDDNWWRGDIHRTTDSADLPNDLDNEVDDNWWRGEVHPEGDIMGDNADNFRFEDDQLTQDEASLAEKFAQKDDITGADLYSNPKIYRALEAAYLWHLSGTRAGIFDINNFPVYALGSDTAIGSINTSPFYLDTYNMTLKVGATSLQLPIKEGDRLPEGAMEIWRELVVPHFIKNMAIRPYDRRDLFYF